MRVTRDQEILGKCPVSSPLSCPIWTPPTYTAFNGPFDPWTLNVPSPSASSSVKVYISDFPIVDGLLR